MIYLSYKRIDLSFSVHNLAKISSNPGKEHSELLVHLLSYIRDNNNLVLKYSADMKDAPSSDLLIQDIIKTDNKFMSFLYSCWQDFQTLAEV